MARIAGGKRKLSFQAGPILALLLPVGREERDRSVAPDHRFCHRSLRTPTTSAGTSPVQVVMRELETCRRQTAFAYLCSRKNKCQPIAKQQRS